MTAYAPALAWAAGILFLGSRPNARLPVAWPSVDKVGHFLMFAGLGGLLAWAWWRVGRRPAWGWLLAGALLLGGADEWHQRVVPGRSSDVRDWAADAVGAAIGFAVVARVWRGGIGKERE